MKVVRLTTVYPRYAERFYAARPGLAAKGYAEQKAALDFDSFGLADFWARALGAKGWEVFDGVVGVGALDAAWAAEHGLAPSAGALEVAASQVASHRPDLLWVDDYNLFSPEWIRSVRAACPSIRMVLGWCGAPFVDIGAFREYDLLMTCIGDLVDGFNAQGLATRRLDHAFDPVTLERLGPPPPRDLDFTFVGQVKRGNRSHVQRERLLEDLVRRTPLALYLMGEETGPKARLLHGARWGAWTLLKLGRALGIGDGRLASLPGLRKALRWEGPPLWPVNAALEGRRAGEVYGLEMLQVLRRSKVTLNAHLDLSRSSASNMRLFESTGAGACLLTDAKADMARIFVEGREVVTYSSADEAAEKAGWLLEHPEEREAIAAAGQARTLKDHSYLVRAESVMAWVAEGLRGKG